MRRRDRLTVVVFAVSGAACGTPAAAPTERSDRLGGQVVAVVGGRGITKTELTQEVARTGASPREVLTALEDRELLRAEAERRGLAGGAGPEGVTRQALVQRVLRDVERDVPASSSATGDGVGVDPVLASRRFERVRTLVDESARRNPVEVREATTNRLLSDDALFERILR